MNTTISFSVLGLACIGLAACMADTSDPTPDEADGQMTAEQLEAGGHTWRRVYRHDFADMHDVTAFQSGIQENAGLSPKDDKNGDLQKPTLKSDVEIIGDPEASDGHALAVYTRIGTYELPGRRVTGWTNGRMMIDGQEYAPPVRIRTRLRMERTVLTKTAVMWWPSKGWPWEVDFAETFGGQSKTDFWGSRQHVAENWHGDVNGDGAAKEQLHQDVDLDATKYHVYDLVILPARMSISIDGQEKFSTTNKHFIPDSPGKFSIGKALTGVRDESGRTPETVSVDWLEILR